MNFFTQNNINDFAINALQGFLDTVKAKASVKNIYTVEELTLWINDICKRLESENNVSKTPL